MSLDVAVVIVTWNVRGLIEQALSSLLADLAASGLVYGVCVVDSASTDDTADVVAQKFPQVRLIASPENLGFGRANNVGIRAFGFDDPQTDPQQLPRAVYLLNPDTITQAGATRALYDALMSAPQVGLVGANLTYGDGSFQHGAFTFPGLRQIYAEFFPLLGRMREGRFNGRYPRAQYAGVQPFSVDFTLGATMMLRREVVLQTGMFDEAFFMYCEEVDWAWRIQTAGWTALCVPSAHVVHLGGQSTSQVNIKSMLHLWESRLRLYDKHHPRWKARLARALIRLGMLRRLRQLALQRAKYPQADALEAAYQQIIEMTQS